MRTAPLAYLSLSVAALAACGGDDGSAAAGGFDDRAIVTDYADQVVIPTYGLLATRASELEAAAQALAAAPNADNLQVARTAWVATRAPWEQSEAFLFGPVSGRGYDPAMDSWPVNRTDLDAVLAADDELTAAYVAGLPETQKGFHTLEYLLWGGDSEKRADALTPRELEYVRALAADLEDITEQLATSWTEPQGGAAAFRAVFTSAGEDGNTAYPSLTAAAQEILIGMSTICDEVANGKIADPFDARDPDLVESQFSFNSLEDFADNIRGVLNAYNGHLGGSTPPADTSSARGLATLVSERDPALDQRVRGGIDAAIAALGVIPSPFRDAIQDEANDAAIIAAQEAIRALQDTIDGDLTAAVLE